MVANPGGTSLLFRQLFEPETSTYSYLLADAETREAILIDPVKEKSDRDVALIGELELTLLYALDTHVHADHVTGSALLKTRLGAQIAAGARAGLRFGDVALAHGDAVRFGRHALEVRATPGHTDCSLSYYLADPGMIFTGDAVLIRGCGRTDFQQGDARTLYRSVHAQVLSLPGDTLIYPGHDYKGHTVSTVAEEERLNPPLGRGNSEATFAAIMEGLDLPYPKRIDEAVPSNKVSGFDPSAEWAPVARTAEGVPEVGVEWTLAHLADTRLIDVREEEELAGPLEPALGAEAVRLDALEAASAPWPRDDRLVVACKTGRRSGRAALLLEDQGFTRVASLAGGMARYHEVRRGG